MEQTFSVIIKNATQAMPGGENLRVSIENNKKHGGRICGDSEKDAGTAVIIDLPAKTQ